MLRPARLRSAALTLAALLAAGAGLQGQERVSDRRAAAAAPSVRIVNGAGSIRIVGWNQDSIAVSGVLADSGGRLVVGGSDRSVKIGIEFAGGSGSADLEVRVPIKSRIWVRAVTAETDIDGVNGEVDATSVSGRIRVAGSPGLINLESIDGNVEVAGECPTVRIKTGGGSAVLRGTTKDLQLSTVTGRLFVAVFGPVEHARLESVSGEIAFKGILDQHGSLDAESHSGDVELRLPVQLEADYDLNAYGGAIRNELGVGPAAGKAGTLHFTVGGGGARVAARTFKGTIVLKAK